MQGQTIAQGIRFSNLEDITAPNLSGAPLGQVVTLLLPYIFAVAGFILLMYLVLGGFQVLTSQSDPKKMAEGREKITSAIVGFIVIFVAFWVIQLIGRILDIQAITDIFG